MKKRYLIGALSGLATAAVVTKLLARPRDVDWEKNRRFVFHAGHSRFADVNGVRVHYQEAGPMDGPAVILIHGFASSTLVWSKVFLEFAARGLRVIAPDLLGYGYSGKPRNFDYTIGAQARMLDKLLEQLGLAQVTLVGSSYGGAIAASIALDYPTRVKKLVLVGAVTNNEPTKYLLMRLFGSPLIGDILSPLLLSSRQLLKRRMKRVYDRHSWVLDDVRVEARHQPLRTAATHRAIIRTVRRWDADRIQREAHLITQPTLLVWGDNDAEVPLRFGQQLLNAIKGARMIIIQNCGHLPHEEFPQAFIEVVGGFCANGNIGETSHVTLEA
ncbi:MAG TPA: alpha/beta hydrolase [Pyrinomonadaceae bacterium]|nr:alpha/beta hydrolase [Pyrinomonadaceae bacterium]